MGPSLIGEQKEKTCPGGADGVEDLEPVSEAPVLHKSLAKETICFRWKHLGWTRARVKQFYSGKRAVGPQGERNVELVIEGEILDALLQLPLYFIVSDLDTVGKAGQWFLAKKKLRI